MIFRSVDLTSGSHGFRNALVSLFARTELIRFFDVLKAKGPVISLSEWDRNSTATLLRHDIDLDVRPAYEMFLLERDAGITASYFFLTSCHTYNPCSLANRKMIREMAEAGFDVGLHFDPLIYPAADEAQLARAAAREADLIAHIAGRDVTALSLHNPSVHGRYPFFDGFINVYQEPYFHEDRYLSDSRMGFRGKDPFDFVEENLEKTIQILLHPLHFTDSGGDYRHIMQNYLRHHVDQLDAQFRTANDAYAGQVIPSELLP